MDSIERKISSAKAAYQTLEYQGAALGPTRLKPSPGGWLARLAWRPALALAALLAVLLTLLPAQLPPDPTPESASVGAVTLGSPMDTLTAARRVLVAVPVAPKRPRDGLFQLPPPPPRPSGFADGLPPELG